MAIDQTCSQHDITYENIKDLSRITASDKVLRDKAFNIARNPKHDGYQRELASMLYKFFDKNISDGAIKGTIISNQKLAEKLHKAIIRKLGKKESLHSLKDSVWGADFAGVQFISKYNNGFRYLLCVIDIFNKYAWLVSLKEKKYYNY